MTKKSPFPPQIFAFLAKQQQPAATAEFLYPFLISPTIKKQEQTDEHELEEAASASFSSAGSSSSTSYAQGSKGRWPSSPPKKPLGGVSFAQQLLRTTALCLALTVLFVLMLVFLVNQTTKMPAFENVDVGGGGVDGQDPSEKSTLPRASDPAVFNETNWSSYRPQLYFGLKNRRPDSPMFGMMWYRQGSAKLAEKLPLRHWAMHEDNVVFMWNKHDGRSFGSQQLTDARLGMHTDWFNFGRSSWMARFYLQRKKEETGEWDQPEALILYFALQDNQSTMEPGKLPAMGSEVNMLWGKSGAVHGSYNLTIRLVDSEGHTSEEKNNMNYVSEMAVHGEPFVDMAHAHDLVKSALRMQPDGQFAFGERPAEKNPNFAALQINIKADSIVEVLFQSEADEKAPDFMDRFHEKQQAFEANFSRAFPILSNYSSLYHKMGHAALSNLLGGIGVWHCSLWMRSKEFEPPDLTKPYGPFSLMSAIPSRTGFPRGFIWDEGFHNMLIHRFDPELTIQIIGAYLDMMNIDGWIPREIVLGTEAEARIPRAYLVQQDWVANPPMFFYLMRDFIQNPELVTRFRSELLRLYPRLKELYFWIRDSQRGPKEGFFASALTLGNWGMPDKPM